MPGVTVNDCSTRDKGRLRRAGEHRTEGLDLVFQQAQPPPEVRSELGAEAGVAVYGVKGTRAGAAGAQGTT